MFKKSITAILLFFLVISGINAQAALPSWLPQWLPAIVEIVEEVVETFFRDNVKPQEVAMLKSKVSDLERQLYLLKQEGHNPPDFDSVEQTVLRLTKIVEAMESRFSLLEDRVTALEKRVTALEQDIPFVRQSLARWKGNSEDAQIIFPSTNNFRAEKQKGRYFVIFGSYPKSEYSKANERFNYLKSLGYVGLSIEDTNNYPNLNNGLYIVTMGPFGRNYALKLRENFSSVISDVYVKPGW
jgi:polyhydroxyalkanoate synthesis regulator phasin